MLSHQNLSDNNIHLNLYRLFVSLDQLSDGFITRDQFIAYVKNLYISDSIVENYVDDGLIVLSSYMIYYANNKTPVTRISEAIGLASKIMRSDAEDKYAALFVLSFIPATRPCIRRILRTHNHNILISFIKPEYRM